MIGMVRFRVRDSAQGNASERGAHAGGGFIGRFLLHVLPKGFKRIRHYGLLGPAHKAANLPPRVPRWRRRLPTR